MGFLGSVNCQCNTSLAKAQGKPLKEAVNTTAALEA
jgi:hypothetical protein